MKGVLGLRPAAKPCEDNQTGQERDRHCQNRPIISPDRLDSCLQILSSAFVP